VFDCAFKPRNGSARSPIRATSDDGGGAAVPVRRHQQDGEHAQRGHRRGDHADLRPGWKLGLKALAIYRDGCKRSQPLGHRARPPSRAAARRRKSREGQLEYRAASPVKLPAERAAITHKFAVGGHEGYITVGLYDDGSAGRDVHHDGQGRLHISGLMDTIATATRLALQYGVPLRALVDRFSHVRFEPSGFTGNPNIPMAKSVVDYIFRWLGQKFVRDDGQMVDSTMSAKAEAAVKAALGSNQMPLPMSTSAQSEREKAIFRMQADSPPCSNCGTITVRAGACYLCPNCGTSSGCG
jgi:ribonucleoside-diphosphate reductase alpha chain